MAPMAFKHFTPNFERARTFTFVHVHILDVRERAPPVTPNFGCARRNGKRPKELLGMSSQYRIEKTAGGGHNILWCAGIKIQISRYSQIFGLQCT